MPPLLPSQILIRRLGFLALVAFVCPLSRASAQVIERPVPFAAGGVTVITPSIAEKAGLRPPSWPVAGDFVEARLYTVDDASYILSVTRRSGAVERYMISAEDREAIRASISRLPQGSLERKSDARNAFIRNQTTLGLTVYGPAFAIVMGDNDAGATAGYLVVAGGSFFAASEISRRMFISRAQNDLSTDTGLKGALAGWAIMYLAKTRYKAQAAGAFIGGLTGTALGLSFGRYMTEAEAVGAGFGSTVGAAIAFGVTEALEKDRECVPLEGQPGCVFTEPDDPSHRGQIATILGSALIGYPLGVLYPRNALYNVTPGDIQVLGNTAGLGLVTAGAFLSENSSERTVAAALTAGAVLGIVAGDRFLVRRRDHSRTDASRLTLGTSAGGLMGLGIAILINSDDPSPQLAYGLAAAGGLIGLIVTEGYIKPDPDAGRRRVQLGLNPAGMVLAAARTRGNHPILSVRF